MDRSSSSSSRSEIGKADGEERLTRRILQRWCRRRGRRWRGPCTLQIKFSPDAELMDCSKRCEIGKSHGERRPTRRILQHLLKFLVQ